ncbi:MAG: cupin domain-containing protein [Dehalococcoidia bacterium]
MAKEERGKHYIKNYELESQTSYSNYPDWLLRSFRFKALIGRDAPIPDTDVGASAFELDPGAYYPGHAHPWPEIYIITSGTAECKWGDETFIAQPGTITHCPPNTSHAMRVTSREPLRAVIVSWAPGGQSEVWDAESRIIEEAG